MLAQTIKNCTHEEATIEMVECGNPHPDTGFLYMVPMRACECGYEERAEDLMPDQDL